MSQDIYIVYTSYYVYIRIFINPHPQLPILDTPQFIAHLHLFTFISGLLIVCLWQESMEEMAGEKADS